MNPFAALNRVEAAELDVLEGLATLNDRELYRQYGFVAEAVGRLLFQANELLGADDAGPAVDAAAEVHLNQAAELYERLRDVIAEAARRGTEGP